MKFRRDFRFSRVRIFEIFENLDFSTFDHCILYSFLRGFSLWQRGIDSTKQMMVYDQITFFIKNRIFDFFFWLRNRFLDRTGPDFFSGPDRTEFFGPVRFLDRTGPDRTGSFLICVRWLSIFSGGSDLFSFICSSFLIYSVLFRWG